jgi:MoaA/NifB/PqqE/SkfB family radical SAM enzyme
MNVTELRNLARGSWSKFSFGLPVLRAKITGRPIPFQVQFTLTNRCNLRCSYCYADYPSRSWDDLTTEQVLAVIDAFAGVGTRRFNLVGGEPMIRKDIGRIVDHVKDQGLECAMTTNGYYARKKLDVLEKLDLVCVSLDGRREAHDICRGAGSFDKALDAMRLAVDVGTPLQVACVLTQYNLDSIEYLLELGKEMGFAVGFSTLISEAGAPPNDRPAYLPTDEQYREALRRILDYKKQGYPVLFSRKSLEYALNWKHGYARDKILGRKPDFDTIRCNAGKYFVIIDANGDVYPCPAMVDVIDAKNVFRDGVKKALEHTGRHPCKTCHIPCMNDFNLLYSLSPGVILNILRSYRSRPRAGHGFSGMSHAALSQRRTRPEPVRHAS